MERYKWSFPFKIIGIVFFLFGAAFLIVPVINIAGWSEFEKDAVPVTARIIDIDTHTTRRSNSHKRTTYHDVYIEYEYEGETYSEELDHYTSGMREGDELEILIDPDDPSKNRSEPYLFSGIMALFGLIFGSIGAAFLIHEIKKGRYINGLIAEDKFIYASYSHEEKANVTVNNVRYNQAVFVYEDGFGRKLIFKSEPYHPNSRPYIQGDSKKVYVDMENDPGKYYVSREK
ncbi:MAG: DUF3592 domain-containing protein [Huintestinicola sp.]|uniref:DUF3592 domain-containing protein n=1 Tax=Huintestinicola sp. TaxID=2981661 RepID=UPI003F094B2E